MAGRGSQAAPSSTNATSSPNPNASVDYINGHGNLPDAPAPAPVPTAAPAKKGKGKRPPDASETSKLLAAKISQLELDAAGEKDQEAEIGGFSSKSGTKDNILASMKDLDLPPDMIAQAMRLLNAGGDKSMIGGGFPLSENMESLSADLAGVSEFLSALPTMFNMAQQKLTTLPPGLAATLEREVKKATRDLTNLLTGMDNPMHKLNTVQQKYTDLLAEMKRVDRENAKNKKRADLFQKEKDQGRSQLTKSDAVKAKLETLCRELQRENKKLKDEQKRIEDSEKASREELSDRVDTVFWEIEESSNRPESAETQKQNLELDELFRQKFKAFLEQYELRELHIHSMLRTKDSEVHVGLARAEDQRKRADTEFTKSRTLSAQVSTFSQTETELRSQLNIYVEKFKQVEDTLNNSNDLFLTFRKEMEEMSKKTKRLEKENLNLTRKHDLTNRNILEMAEERTKVNKEMETLRKKNNTLESVIRGMQHQGRAPAGAGALEGDEEGTESDYEEDDYDEEEGSEEEGEYDEDTEEEALQAQVGAPVTFGPVPPPPPTTTSSATVANQARVNGHVHPRINGEVNGAKPGVT